MKFFYAYFFTLLLVTVSCSLEDSNNDRENELAFLIQQKNVIEQLAISVPCTEGSTCKYVAFGSKPCGGPRTYLAYNSTIDEEFFLNQVAIYNTNEDVYNLKWDVLSDCMAVLPPTSVDCIDGKCTTVYN